ncbi:MAG: phenylalanine--tRNA ligase subunit beta [Clostridiaceae bacterium]|nr:phenylalanine--tRNA ligase subunit beta [Clostridiaceae bacterium]
MKLSYNWLRELVPVTASPKDYIAAMTMSGSKVETLDYLGAEIENVVVGRVVSMEHHPDADKLWICQLDVGCERNLQIVTGAQNVSVGDIVPVAQDCAKLPGGIEIHTGELRGVKSEGMLCSHQELGLTTHDIPDAPEHGILLLGSIAEYGKLTPGQDIRPVLGFDDYCVDFEITPNRPDCLSVIGLARESAATYGMRFEPAVPKVRGGAGKLDEYLAVTVEEPALCPRYAARLVRNVRIKPSPKWMRDKLRSMGVRPINNIVDITNFVMLEYGQPMHAFDYGCLSDSRIVVRRAGKDEPFQTLDSQERKLSPNMLVIADGTRPVAVAGVMGGANSEITGSTRNVVFESANFSGVSVRLTARALGMRTESSGRFEKGLDPRNVGPALERACELVELLGAGDVCDGVIDVDHSDPAPRELTLDDARINRFLGIDLPRETMVKYLANLSFGVDGDKVVVPSWRGDVEQFADLAEEVARFYGYDKIPTTLFAGAAPFHRSEKIVFEDTLRTVCAGLGCSEIQTYSFISEKVFDKLNLPADDPKRRVLAITNPLSEDMRVMRTTAVPSMLEVLSRNANMKNARARLFELSSTYEPKLRADGTPDDTQLPTERCVLTLGLYGDGDFYTMKSLVDGIARALRLPGLRYTARLDNPAFHPGRAADVYAGDTYLGTLGQVHPRVAEAFELPVAGYIAEISAQALMAVRGGIVQYKPLPRFPCCSRDLAIVCDESISVSELEDCIRCGAGEVLECVRLFDIYRSDSLGEGKKSVAFSLLLRDPARTLKDTDADAATEKAVAALTKIGAKLRA